MTADTSDVAERLRQIDANLPEWDGVAVFNQMYLTVTERVRELLDSGGFSDARKATILTGVFAGYYLDAVDAEGAGRQVPTCWRPLFRLRGHPGIHPLQFALAGMNAHIEHDLPLAVLTTCVRVNSPPDDLAATYQRVDQVLSDVDEKVRAELLPDPDLWEWAEPLTHLVSSWSVTRAREAAWVTAHMLWRMRETPELLQECSESLDRGVGMVTRQLLTPTQTTRQTARSGEVSTGSTAVSAYGS